MANIRFTRDNYKAVKKMDRQQMEAYFNDVFDKGYNTGIHKAGKEVTMRVDAALHKTSWIGEKRYKELTDNINRELNTHFEIVDTHTVNGVMYNIYSANHDEHFEAYTPAGEFVMSGDTREELYKDLDGGEHD